MTCCGGAVVLLQGQANVIRLCYRMNKSRSAVTARSLRWPLWCRRAERREDAVAMLRSRGYGLEVDLSPAESEGNFLEGTGVLVRPSYCLLERCCICC